MIIYSSKIKEARKFKGLSQEELAKKAGISVMSIRRYESGERIPNEDTLQKIADAMDEIPDSFYGPDLKDEFVSKVFSNYIKDGKLELPGLMDGEIERIEKQFPAATVTETDDKVIFHIIEKPTEVPDSESLRRKLLLEKYDALTPKGKLKVLDYTCELSRLPEYRQTSKKGKDE